MDFNEKKVIVTGGAGFIGSHIVDKLLADGAHVLVLDNMVTGQAAIIEGHKKNKNYAFQKIDLFKDVEKLKIVFKDKDFVFHVAANADIRGGMRNTRADLEQNTIATYNILESMRLNDVKNICFTSSAAVYGDTKFAPTPEDSPLIQNSLYGASKIAGEALIEAFSSYYDLRNYIYRFVSIVGERYTHGVVIDFFHKLKKNHNQLEILGNGSQKKSFLYIEDCINGVFLGIEKASDRTNIFNLGHGYTIEVNKVADIVIEEMGLMSVARIYSGGEIGWKGDQKIVLLSTEKIKAFGWQPKVSIEEGIRRTVRDLINSEKSS